MDDGYAGTAREIEAIDGMILRVHASFLRGAITQAERDRAATRLKGRLNSARSRTLYEIPDQGHTMPRSRRDHTLQIRFAPDELARLDSLVDAEPTGEPAKHSRAGIIRSLIDQAASKLAKKPKESPEIQDTGH